jgi:hypothetical protein
LFAQPCIDSSLINPSIECIALLKPVCGCDGITYGNSCIASNYYGITEFSDGPCVTQVPDTFFSKRKMSSKKKRRVRNAK